MAKLVSPQVFLVGATEMDLDGVGEYLRRTGQEAFLHDVAQARSEGVPSGMILCSMFAKLCYKSLVPGKNANVSRVRGVQKNLESCFDTGHGSIFEHLNLNYVVTDCSRVYTHEQVRHRVGWAYSQTSGRYCRLDEIDLVWDPVLDPVKDLFLNHVGETEDVVYLAECRLGLRKPPALGLPHPDRSVKAEEYTTRRRMNRDSPGTWTADEVNKYKWVPDDSFDFERRKKITSAIRRIAPNGQANEIGMTCNVRALRHVVQLRTARFAEREIRDIYYQVYSVTKAKFPLLFHGARERVHDGIPEVYGMRQQPYDVKPPDEA